MKRIQQATKYVLATLVLITACGREENVVTRPSSELDLQTSPQIEKRFTPEEIAKVYTNQPAPFQTGFISYSYEPNTAPDSFKAEYPVFTKGIELKGFFSMSQQPTGGEPNDDSTAKSIVSTLQQFTKWKEITKRDGRKLLDDAYTTDSWGEKIPDVKNGLIRKDPDVHYASITTQGIGVGLTLSFSKKELGQINADVTNPKDVDVIFVGTVVKAKGIKIHFEFFPYQNGWLYYAAGAPKLEKFTERANDFNEVAEAVVLWAQKKVGK